MSDEKIIPEHGEYGGPMVGGKVYYEDGSEVHLSSEAIKSLSARHNEQLRIDLREAVDSCEYRDSNALSLQGTRRVIFKDDVLQAIDKVLAKPNG